MRLVEFIKNVIESYKQNKFLWHDGLDKCRHSNKEKFCHHEDSKKYKCINQTLACYKECCDEEQEIKEADNGK